MLFPIRILTNLVVHLSSVGVILHSNGKVDAVDPERGTVTVGGTLHSGDTVIVAAGAWADRLVPSPAEIAVPSRQAVLYVAPPPELPAAWPQAPMILDLGEKAAPTRYRRSPARA